MGASSSHIDYPRIELASGEKAVAVVAAPVPLASALTLAANLIVKAVKPANGGANAGKVYLGKIDGGTPQVETATVAGTVTTAGNATVTVTAAGMTNSPKAISVAVALADDASAIAGKIRAALAADADVTALFAVSGTGTAVVLTRLIPVANDGTLNIAVADDTSVGVTTSASSANTTAGVAGSSPLFELSPGESREFAAQSIGLVDLSKVWLRALTAGDGVVFSYLVPFQAK